MTVPCRFCGEEIAEAAVKCKHCGEFLEDRDPSSSSGMHPVVIGLLVLVALAAMCMVVAIVAAILIPNMIPARRVGNEASAIGGLKTLQMAQTLFREGDKEADEVLDYGDLYELGQTRLIDQVLASGVKQGYRFDSKPSSQTPEFLWFATADPALPLTTGDRYFATNHEGVIFYSKTAPIPMNTGDCAFPADRLASGDIRPVGK